MVKFGISVKDRNTDVSVTGEDITEVLHNLKELQKLKIESDKILGFDIKLPDSIVEKISSIEYADRILVMLYYSEKPINRFELHQRNSVLRIREAWWGGSNFSRDMKQKKNSGLIEISSELKQKYKISQKGIRHVKKIMSLEEKE